MAQSLLDYQNTEWYIYQKQIVTLISPSIQCCHKLTKSQLKGNNKLFTK